MAGAESSSSDSEALAVTESAYTTAHVEGGAVFLCCGVSSPSAGSEPNREKDCGQSS